VVPVVRKLSTIEERCQDQSCLFRREDFRNKGHNPDGEKIAGTKVTNPTSVVGSSLGEDVGFRNKFLCDIQRYISNDQAYYKHSDNKGWLKM
jgi:hypothetical protein